MKFHVNIGNEVWADVIVPDHDLEEIAEVLSNAFVDTTGIAPIIGHKYVEHIDIRESDGNFMVGLDILFLNNVLKITFPTCLQDFHLLDDDGNVNGAFVEAVSGALAVNPQFAIACESMLGMDANLESPAEGESREVAEDLIKNLQQRNK